MNEPQKCCADQNKPETKDHKLYESMYMKFLDKAKLRDRKQIRGCLELGVDMD